MDAWTDGLTDRWMDGRMLHVCMRICMYVCFGWFWRNASVVICATRSLNASVVLRPFVLSTLGDSCSLSQFHTDKQEFLCFFIMSNRQRKAPSPNDTKEGALPHGTKEGACDFCWIMRWFRSFVILVWNCILQYRHCSNINLEHRFQAGTLSSHRHCVLRVPTNLLGILNLFLLIYSRF